MSSNDHALFQALKFRCIGPPRGGRVLAVHGHPTEQMTFYFGACAGGIWKTDDGGTYWQNISDGFLNSAAVGALTVSESDPNVIYAGMGESTLRLDVSYGDGVYKSTNSGKTWQHMGLAATKHISEIRIHPHNPDVVYVAALGHAFGPNAERGIYRSKDGGRSWDLVLHKSIDAGAADLAMDMNNPRTLFASIYQVRRHQWTLQSGGPDSGLWRTTDGGDTWEDISHNKGLPKVDKLGKIGVAVSRANSNRVWALIEAADDEKAGLYRSDDGGDTWALMTNNRDLMHRPWYYMHVFADPCNVDTVYVTNLKMWKSTDGGKNFEEITTPHGDNHDLWIDPHNPQRMIEGNDGGANVSFNGGATWSTIYNQKTAQFYHVAVDTRHPYHVYGTQQDNSSIGVPSASEQGGIPWGACYAAGTGESGYIAVKPDDPNVVFVGAIGSSPGGGNALQRYDHRTKQIRLVTTWPDAYYGMGADAHKYRFAWTYPIVFSPHDSNILYIGGNHVFKSTDEGSSWQMISPDLSRADPEKLKPSGGLTLDTSGAETYATVYAFAESPHEAGVFWAGTDDGLVHLSRDDGATWSNITPSGLPEWAVISMVEASPHAAGTVYLAATRYKLDDYAPYLYKTTDYGATWQKLDAFPADEITRCVREDPKQEGLLYVGTETGIFVSLDGGAGWQRLQNNFPVVPVYDLVVKDDDLVVGTHGRSFWILDDVNPLRELAAGKTNGAAHLFAPKPTYRQWVNWFANAFRGPGKNYMMALGATMAFTEMKGEGQEIVRNFLDAGENPPYGVIVYYSLPAEVEGSLSLSFLDKEGKTIRTYTPKPEPPASNNGAEKPKEDPNARYMTAKPGLNRFVWDMRYPDCVKPEGDKVMESAVTGPVAAPGTYQVQLKIGELVQTQPFEIRIDPKVNASQEDLDAQFQLWQRINDKLSETHEAINRIKHMKEQVAAVEKRFKRANDDPDSAVVKAAAALKDKLETIEGALIQSKATNPRDRLRLPAKLNGRLANLISVVSSADAAPTKQSYDVFSEVVTGVDEQLALLDGLLGDDIPAFNDLVAGSKVPVVVV